VWPMAAVFALATMRAAVVPRATLTPKQVGIGEVALNVLVVAVAFATL